MTRVIAANWDAVRFFSCKLEQIFSCKGWILLEAMYNLVWRLFRGSEQPLELVLHIIKSGTYKTLKKFLVGKCVNLLWVLWEVMKGEAGQLMFQNAAHNPPKSLKPNLICLSLLNVCILLTFCAGDSKPNKQTLAVIETLN